MYEIKEKESTVSSVDILVLNPFLTNVSILYPLKIRQNQRFSVFFREYRMGTLARKNSGTAFFNSNISNMTKKLAKKFQKLILEKHMGR